MLGGKGLKKCWIQFYFQWWPYIGRLPNWPKSSHDIQSYNIIIHTFMYIIISATMQPIYYNNNNNYCFNATYSMSECVHVHACMCRRWSRKFAWKVADGVATHSKPYWCKGGGWLIMVDISYTTLHKRIGEGGWLATLSTPPGSAPACVCVFVYWAMFPENNRNGRKS